MNKRSLCRKIGRSISVQVVLTTCLSTRKLVHTGGYDQDFRCHLLVSPWHWFLFIGQAYQMRSLWCSYWRWSVPLVILFQSLNFNLGLVMLHSFSHDLNNSYLSLCCQLSWKMILYDSNVHYPTQSLNANWFPLIMGTFSYSLLTSPIGLQVERRRSDVMAVKWLSRQLGNGWSAGMMHYRNMSGQNTVAQQIKNIHCKICISLGSTNTSRHLHQENDASLKALKCPYLLV